MGNGENQAEKPKQPSPARLLLRLLAFVSILAAILFLSAGRLDWVMGWVYMGMYASVTVAGVLLVPLDP